MHIGRAKIKAAALAIKEGRAMAVVHCGCGEYTVKALLMATAVYPAADIVATFKPAE